MASKENLFRITRNITFATTVAVVGCKSVENTKNSDVVPETPTRNLVLTPSEIQEMQRIENFISAFAVEPRKEEVVSEIQASVETSEATSASETKLIPVELMTVEGQELIDGYRRELPAVIEDIGATGQDVEDLLIYYPIYRAAQDRYGVPWYLMWIIHAEESRVSINPEGLDGPVHYGAMQRALEFHTNEDVDYTNRGLEFLGALPTRRFDDAREIIWATAAVSEWAGGNRDYHRALLKYSAAVHAENRWQKYLVLKEEIDD